MRSFAAIIAILIASTGYSGLKSTLEPTFLPNVPSYVPLGEIPAEEIPHEIKEYPIGTGNRITTNTLAVVASLFDGILERGAFIGEFLVRGTNDDLYAAADLERSMWTNGVYGVEKYPTNTLRYVNWKPLFEAGDLFLDDTLDAHKGFIADMTSSYLYNQSANLEWNLDWTPYQSLLTGNERNYLLGFGDLVPDGVIWMGVNTAEYPHLGVAGWLSTLPDVVSSGEPFDGEITYLKTLAPEGDHALMLSDVATVGGSEASLILSNIWHYCGYRISEKDRKDRWADFEKAGEEYNETQEKWKTYYDEITSLANSELVDYYIKRYGYDIGRYVTNWRVDVYTNAASRTTNRMYVEITASSGSSFGYGQVTTNIYPQTYARIDEAVDMYKEYIGWNEDGLVPKAAAKLEEAKAALLPETGLTDRTWRLDPLYLALLADFEAAADSQYEPFLLSGEVYTNADFRLDKSLTSADCSGVELSLNRTGSGYEFTIPATYKIPSVTFGGETTITNELPDHADSQALIVRECGEYTSAVLVDASQKAASIEISDSALKNAIEPWSYGQTQLKDMTTLEGSLYIDMTTRSGQTLWFSMDCDAGRPYPIGVTDPTYEIQSNCTVKVAGEISLEGTSPLPVGRDSVTGILSESNLKQWKREMLRDMRLWSLGYMVYVTNGTDVTIDYKWTGSDPMEMRLSKALGLDGRLCEASNAVVSAVYSAAEELRTDALDRFSKLLDLSSDDPAAFDDRELNVAARAISAADPVELTGQIVPGLINSDTGLRLVVNVSWNSDESHFNYKSASVVYSRGKYENITNSVPCQVGEWNWETTQKPLVSGSTSNAVHKLSAIAAPTFQTFKRFKYNNMELEDD